MAVDTLSDDDIRAGLRLLGLSADFGDTRDPAAARDISLPDYSGLTYSDCTHASRRRTLAEGEAPRNA